jgi:hypothetical protein
VYGLRRPVAQIARFTPVVVAKNGLSLGIVPFVLMRRIFPNGFASDCGCDVSWCWPTPT